MIKEIFKEFVSILVYPFVHGRSREFWLAALLLMLIVIPTIVVSILIPLSPWFLPLFPLIVVYDFSVLKVFAIHILGDK